MDVVAVDVQRSKFQRNNVLAHSASWCHIGLLASRHSLTTISLIGYFLGHFSQDMSLLSWVLEEKIFIKNENIVSFVWYTSLEHKTVALPCRSSRLACEASDPPHSARDSCESVQRVEGVKFRRGSIGQTSAVPSESANRVAPSSNYLRPSRTFLQ